MITDLSNRLIEDISERANWDQALSDICALTGYETTLAHTFSSSGEVLSTVSSPNLDEYWTNLDIELSHMNPRYKLARYVSDNTARVFSDIDAITPNNAKRNDWYQTVAKKAETYSMLVGTVPTKTQNRYVLAVQKGVDWHDPVERDVIQFRNILRGISTAYTIADLLHSAQCKSVIELLETGDHICCVISRNRTLGLCSSSFENWLNSTPDVSVRFGRLSFVNGENNDLLDGILCNARQEHTTFATTQFKDGKSRRLTLLPLPWQRTGVAAACGVLIVEEPRLPALDYDRFALDFSLTPAELAIMPLVKKGVSASEIATRRRVEVSTVRSQISSIIAKTGLSSRMELLALVSRYGQWVNRR